MPQISKAAVNDYTLSNTVIVGILSGLCCNPGSIAARFKLTSHRPITDGKASTMFPLEVVTMIKQNCEMCSSIREGVGQIHPASDDTTKHSLLDAPVSQRQQRPIEERLQV